MSQAQSSFYNYVTTGAAVPTVPAAPPPGVVQGAINYNVLLTALADFGLVTADAVNVFAEDFQAIILEALTAGILASSIVGNIESAILIGQNVKPAVAAAAATASAAPGVADPSATVTASSLLSQLLQQDAANLTLVRDVFTNAQGQGQYANLPAGFEAQFLGGQILFQQDISTFLNSLPTSLSPTNDANPTVISELQALLQLESNLSNTLNQIQTYQDLEQPIQLTGLNVVVLLDDAAILTEAALVAASYAYFAYESYTPSLVTKTTPGAYSVTVPSGAKFVDIVLIGGGGGGGGYDTPGAGTGGNGGNTTATPAGGSTLTAAGGPGGASGTGTAATAGQSPGNETFDGPTYNGGNGGAAGYNGAGGNGSSPGAGGGGGGSYGSYGGAGGTAGSWATETIAVTSGMTTITGTVGAGGTAGVAENSAIGGTGGNGAAYFNFYS